MRVALIGIDPGVVHTGAVCIYLDQTTLDLRVDHEALIGKAPHLVQQFVQLHYIQDRTFVFVEKFRDRGQVFGTNTEMRKLEHDIRQQVPDSVLLDNTGVKKVVTDDLMKLLGVWQFSTPTNHQDLRSAARIALYGGLKDEQLNSLLTRVVIARLGLTTPPQKRGVITYV